jgi:hypothetical protein
MGCDHTAILSPHLCSFELAGESVVIDYIHLCSALCAGSKVDAIKQRKFVKEKSHGLN